MMDVFNVGILNVNGARDARKRAAIYEAAKLKRINVLFLQETHSDSVNEADWVREWEGEVFLSHNTALSAGVGVLFSRNFNPATVQVEQVIPGRCIVVRAVFEHFTVVFINIYAPNTGTERKAFYEKINDRLKDQGSGDY